MMVMSRLKKHVIALLAAATIAADSLVVATPPASAMPISCTYRIALSWTYIGTGDAYFAVGNYTMALVWYQKAETILFGC
jgi:hypothetical protein